MNKNHDSVDQTPRVSSLEAAKKAPVSVKPDDNLRKAVTLMLRHDFSQLPVMQSRRSVSGVISWKSIGEQSHVHNRECRLVRDCMDENFKVLKLDDLLWKGITELAEHDFVLVENQSREICGLITTSDIAGQYYSLAEPFLLLGEIENNIRQLISRAGFSLSVLTAVRDPRDARREIRGVSDLSFGEYLRILQDPDNFKSLGFGLSRTTFINDLTIIKNIRNEVMHFRPGGLDGEKLHSLRGVAKMFRRLNLWSKPELKISAEKSNPINTAPRINTQSTPTNKKLRIGEIIASGRVNPGDRLNVIGKAESDAEVVDSKRVRLKNGQIMTWNEYGEKFTGHVAVNVYRHVVVNGVPLESLRFPND